MNYVCLYTLSGKKRQTVFGSHGSSGGGGPPDDYYDYMCIEDYDYDH